MNFLFFFFNLKFWHNVISMMAERFSQWFSFILIERFMICATRRGRVRERKFISFESLWVCVKMKKSFRKKWWWWNDEWQFYKYFSDNFSEKMTNCFLLKGKVNPSNQNAKVKNMKITWFQHWIYGSEANISGVFFHSLMIYGKGFSSFLAAYDLHVEINHSKTLINNI